MSDSLDGRPRLGEISEAGVTEYKPLSGLAVCGLLFGFLAPLAFVGPLLYVFPIVGILLSVAALVRIGADPDSFKGRGLAMAGLVLSILCLSMAPSHRHVTRYLQRNEARRFAQVWFQFLSKAEPHKAHQLSRTPWNRHALDDQLWDVYEGDERLAYDLKEFTDNSAVAALLSLGDRATVRFYETILQVVDFGNERVDLLFAVTSEDDDGNKQTFFVGLKMIRVIDDGRANWYVNDVHESARPRKLDEPSA